MPVVLPDRTMNTLLKEVILKSVIVIYESQSPTRNREAAIKKMLEAGEFIAKHGVDMTQEWFDNLGNKSMELIDTQHKLSTRWRDFFKSPVKTYMSARDFKTDCEAFLADAKTASAQAECNLSRELREEKKAKKAAQLANAAQLLPAPQSAAIIPVRAVDITTPASLSSSAPRHSDLYTAAGDDRAYIRFGDLEMRIPLDGRARIGFDGEVLTTSFRAGSIKTQDSAPGDQPFGTVKRTASIFTVSGTARVITQPDTSNGDPSQSRDEEAPKTCKLEWLEGPIVTALTEVEGGEPGTVGGASDSDPSPN